MINIDLNVLETCSSTNDIAKNEAIKGSLEGSSYLSYSQSNGRGRNKNKWKSIILSVLKEFNLDYMLSLNLKSLSGGELQLLALVRGILIHPDILFYDEPTNNLDRDNVETIAKMIYKFHLDGSSIIIVSHDDVLTNILKHDEIVMKEGALS